MRIVHQIIAAAFVVFFIVACGESGKEKKGGVNDKKVELEKLKAEQTKVADKIRALESEIAQLDPSAVEVKAKLVNVTTLSKSKFTHYIDLQGKITTDNIYYVTPRGVGGQVKAVYVKEGDVVKKGQLILKLDDALMLQNLGQLETQLAFAKNLYQRQKNLWDQGIGTEVQYITAKNNVDAIERQISTIKEQWNTSFVHAEAAGIVETVNIRVGEVFTGSPQLGGITIVNPSKLKAEVMIPENYLSRVKKGTPVVVQIPDASKTYNTSISLISQLIDNTSRGFTAEARMPNDPSLKPNQMAIVKIQDYTVSGVIVIPMNTIQTDEKGKYVYVMADEKGKKIAKKRPVMAGEIYGEMIEIRQGLNEGEELITQGFQGLYEGQLISTEIKKAI